MNKNWITGLTLASVVGTGGAAFAGMRATTHDSVQAQGETPTSAVATTVAGVSASYAAAEAGTVNVTLLDGVITVDSTVPNSGWSVVSFTVPGSHVEVVFTDGTRSITFYADVVNGEIEAGVADTTPTTSTVAPVTSATPAPQPTVLVPSTQPPSSSHTTAASKGDDDDDGHESEDHEEEHEEGDDD